MLRTLQSPPQSPNFSLRDSNRISNFEQQSLDSRARVYANTIAATLFDFGVFSTTGIDNPNELCYFHVEGKEFSFNPIEGLTAWSYKSRESRYKLSVYSWSKSTTDESQYLLVRLETRREFDDGSTKDLTVFEFGFVNLTDHGLYYRIGTGQHPKSYDYHSIRDFEEETSARQVLYGFLSISLKEARQGKPLMG